MFYCQATKTLSKANEPAHKLVTHIRNKAYFRTNKYGQAEVAGHGWEIVREILVTREYFLAKQAEGFKPEVVREKEV